MIHRTYFVTKQEQPATSKPWYVSCTVINEIRETVHSRLEAGPYATREEAEAKCRELDK